MVWLDPSGRVSWNAIVCPALGLDVIATESDGGDPDGPVTVAPVSPEFTPASWKPNGEPSWPTFTVEPLLLMVRRPRPLVPWSASWRSVMTCVRPACEPLPLRISEVLATDGWL